MPLMRRLLLTSSATLIAAVVGLYLLLLYGIRTEWNSRGYPTQPIKRAFAHAIQERLARQWRAEDEVQVCRTPLYPNSAIAAGGDTKHSNAPVSVRCAVPMLAEQNREGCGVFEFLWKGCVSIVAHEYLLTQPDILGRVVSAINDPCQYNAPSYEQYMDALEEFLPLKLNRHPAAYKMGRGWGRDLTKECGYVATDVYVIRFFDDNGHEVSRLKLQAEDRALTWYGLGLKLGIDFNVI